MYRDRAASRVVSSPWDTSPLPPPYTLMLYYYSFHLLFKNERKESKFQTDFLKFCFCFLFFVSKENQLEYWRNSHSGRIQRRGSIPQNTSKLNYVFVCFMSHQLGPSRRSVRMDFTLPSYRWNTVNSKSFIDRFCFELSLKFELKH